MFSFLSPLFHIPPSTPSFFLLCFFTSFPFPLSLLLPLVHSLIPFFFPYLLSRFLLPSLLHFHQFCPTIAFLLPVSPSLSLHFLLLPPLIFFLPSLLPTFPLMFPFLTSVFVLFPCSLLPAPSTYPPFSPFFLPNLHLLPYSSFTPFSAFLYPTSHLTSLSPFFPSLHPHFLFITPLFFFFPHHFPRSFSDFLPLLFSFLPLYLFYFLPPLPSSLHPIFIT